MYIGLYVKYRLFFSHINETWIFSTDFRKNTEISNFMKIIPVGAELIQKEGRTDRNDESNSSLFAKFLENS